MTTTIKQDIQQYYDFWFGINAVYEAWAKKHGLTSNELFTIYAIQEFQPDCTQKLLCQKLLLSKQTVNSILNKFETMGYIQKTGTTSDKRTKCLVFTQQGKLYANALLTELYQFENLALLSMTQKERQLLTQTNQKFLQSLQNAFIKEEIPIP